MTHPHFKPYVAEHARAGAPVGAINGNTVSLHHFHGDRIIGVMMTPQGVPFAAEWNTETGKYTTPIVPFMDQLGLVMLPVAMLDARPVFAYDRLESHDGSPVTVLPTAQTVDHLRWPKEAPEFPKTTMTGEELAMVAKKGSGSNYITTHGLVYAANAAIERAIKDGQVFMPGQPSAEFPYGGVPKEMLYKVAEEIRNAAAVGVGYALTYVDAERNVANIDIHTIVHRVMKGQA